MKATTLRSLGASLREFIAGIWRRGVYWVPAFLLDPFDFYNNYIRATLPESLRVQVKMPAEYFGTVLGLGVAWAGILTYHELRMKHLDAEKRMLRALEITYDPNHPACRRISIAQPPGPVPVERGRSYGIRLTNTSATETVDAIVVSLENLQYEETGAGVSPESISVARRGINRALKAADIPPLSLHPGESEIFDVVSRLVGPIPPAQRHQFKDGLLNLHSASWDQGMRLKDDRYRADLVARGRNTPEHRIHIRFHVDEKYRLHFETIDL